MSFEAAGHHGGLAFSLDLSAKRQQMLQGRADPADDLRRYISRELRKAFGQVLPYSFGFEVSPDGKLHLHGVVMPLDHSPAHREALGRALARAGGKIAGRAASRQVKLTALTDGLGWAIYSQKAFDDACRFLGTDKITFMTADMNRLARELHEELSLNSKNIN